MGDGMGDAIIEMNVEHSTSNIELYVGNKSNLKLFLARITRVSLFLFAFESGLPDCKGTQSSGG